MNGKGSLALKLVDVYGEPINDQVDVSLAHAVLSDKRRITRQDAKALPPIPTLDCTQDGIYRLLVYPTRYRPVSQFVRISEGKPTEKTLVFPRRGSPLTTIYTAQAAACVVCIQPTTPK